METLDLSECLSMNEEELLNLDFNLNGEEEDDDKTKATFDDHGGAVPEFEEEELEWLSNKDAFPAVETCLDILSNPSGLVPNHKSPISVLENCSNINNTIITNYCSSIQVPVSYPVGPRSKRRRRRQIGFPELPSQQCWWWDQENEKKQLELTSIPHQRSSTAANVIGRRCQHCLAEKTPQWRAGPMGPKTLCNACGVRFKSGRLVPEYRPANSPTFSSVLHSNSHRKIVEMRKNKQPGEMTQITMNEARGYNVGYR